MTVPIAAEGWLRHRDRQAMNDAPAVHEPLEVVRRARGSDRRPSRPRRGRCLQAPRLLGSRGAPRPVAPCHGGLPAPARDRTGRRRSPRQRRGRRSARRRRCAAAFRWASYTDAGSASKPTTSACGNALAIASVDQPAPHPTSATRIGVDVSALWRSGSAGIQRVDQIRQKRRPIDAGLTRAECRAEHGIRYAPATPIGVGNALERPTDAGDHLRQRGEVRRMVFGDQHVHVLGREPVPPCLRRSVGRFDARNPATACCSSHSRA